MRVPEFKKPRGARYTPLSRRQDRPNAILWLLRNHPELKDAQIMRLVGTTKHTLEAIRERSHWNSANLQPMDPVTLGLCSQIDLDFEVNRAAKDRPKVEEDRTQTLVSAEITTARPSPSSQAEVFGARRAPSEADRGEDRRRFRVRQAQGTEEGGVSRALQRAASATPAAAASAATTSGGARQTTSSAKPPPRRRNRAGPAPRSTKAGL